MSVPQYNFYIDWEDDGDFVDAEEDVSLRTVSSGVRWERGRDQVRQLAPPFAGALDATLDNVSGDYSPENAASPLFGLVEPGIEVKLEAVAPDYRTTVAADNPVSHWRLDELSGTTAADAEGVSDGTYESGTTPGAAALVVGGRAADFDGATGYVSIPHVAAYAAITAEITLEAWVRLDTLPTSGNNTLAMIITMQQTSTNAYLCFAAGTARMGLRIDGTGRTVNGTTTPVVGQLYHLVGTYDGDKMRIYVNGVLEGTSVSWVGALTPSATTKAIGRYSATAGQQYYVDGLIDEVAVYDTALDATRIAAHYAAGLGTGGDTATTALFRGILEEPSIDSEGQTLGIRALGRLSKLAGQLISSQVYTAITTDEAFEHVCRLAGLAVSEYTALDTGATTLQIWWCNEDDAFTMLARILAAEGPGAAIYEQADGVIAFHSRHYRLLTTRCTTSQATFRDTGADPLHTSPYSYNRGAAGVVNSASIVVKTATLAVSDTTVWEWEGAVFIPPGETRSWYLELQDPISNPAATPGYDVGHVSATFEAEVGGGFPITGQRIRLDLVNDSATFGPGGPAVGLTVTSLGVLAQVYSSTEETVSSAVAATVRRTLPSSYSPWPYIAREVAQDFCDAIVNAYQSPRAVVSITVENATATDLAQILAREIGDRITIVDARSHVSHEFFIERMAHEISGYGQVHRVTFGCEKAGAIDWLIWDESNWDEASWAY